MPSMMIRQPLVALLVSIFAGSAMAQTGTAPSALPVCRLDNANAGIIQATLKRAIDAYAAIGKPLAIDSIAVNPSPPSLAARVLDVYVVVDAAKADAGGCASRMAAAIDALDAVSVRGGCVVTSVTPMELRCSSSAVDIFVNAGRSGARESIALLYVLAHELGYLYQNRRGEYAGSAEKIDLSQAAAVKLDTLRESCEPVSAGFEEQADAASFEILVKLVGGSPYRDRLLSERGSVYSNIDQLALAADAWQKLNARRDFLSRPPLHKAFEPTDFPTPAGKIEQNAKAFVCDVLKGKKGNVVHPGRSISHPPMEQRLRRIAEQLRPVADRLPSKPGDPDFKPVAVVYGDLGPILTFMYRETGAYTKSLQEKICARVNGPQPDAGCP